MKTWTPDEEDYLTALVADGLTAIAAARLLGKTKNSVISKASCMGLRWARSTTVDPVPRPRLEFPERRRCLWLHGDVGEPDAHWCAAPTADNYDRPYCPEHLARVYRPAWVLGEA